MSGAQAGNMRTLLALVLFCAGCGLTIDLEPPHDAGGGFDAASRIDSTAESKSPARIAAWPSPIGSLAPQPDRQNVAAMTTVNT